MGSPDVAAQQRMVDAKNAQKNNQVPLFSVGRERAYVEERLHSFPHVEIVTTTESFITYIARIMVKTVEGQEAMAKIPTDTITHRTGPNTWESTQVQAKPIQTIMGGREGIKDVYADGTVVVRKTRPGVIDEVWEIKVQATFTDGLVDACKVLSKAKL